MKINYTYIIYELRMTLALDDSEIGTTAARARTSHHKNNNNNHKQSTSSDSDQTDNYLP